MPEHASVWRTSAGRKGQEGCLCSFTNARPPEPCRSGVTSGGVSTPELTALLSERGVGGHYLARRLPSFGDHVFSPFRRTSMLPGHENRERSTVMFCFFGSGARGSFTRILSVLTFSARSVRILPSRGGNSKEKGMALSGAPAFHGDYALSRSLCARLRQETGYRISGSSWRPADEVKKFRNRQWKRFPHGGQGMQTVPAGQIPGIGVSVHRAEGFQPVLKENGADRVCHNPLTSAVLPCCHLQGNNHRRPGMIQPDRPNDGNRLFPHGESRHVRDSSLRMGKVLFFLRFSVPGSENRAKIGEVSMEIHP